MKVLSLFTGIGGIDLGLEWAGMTTTGQVEIDEFCVRVLERRWPGVVRYRDVRDLPLSSMETPDLICGGFPCQPVSIAGRKEGTSDPRWLWPPFASVVDALRPRYVLVENVPNLRRLGGAEVVADLAEMGYDSEWGELSASAFGASHIRRRFFLVAYTDSPRRQQVPGSAHGDEGTDAGRAEEEADELAGDGEGDRTGDVAVSDRSRRSDSTQSDAWTRLLGGRERDHTPSRRSSLGEHRGWETDPADGPQPRMGRVAPRVPGRVDRLRALGNAVVPQVAQYIGERILAHEAADLPH